MSTMIQSTYAAGSPFAGRPTGGAAFKFGGAAAQPSKGSPFGGAANQPAKGGRRRRGRRGKSKSPPPPRAASPFGAAAAPKQPGAPPARRTFGAENAPSPFGAENAPSPFGAENAPNPFGPAKPNPSPFGPATTCAPSPFAPAPSPFGAAWQSVRAPAVPFGQTPRARVQAIYRRCNPGKLAEVPKLMKKVAGREDQLVSRLETKYAEELAATLGAANRVADRVEGLNCGGCSAAAPQTLAPPRPAG